MKSLFLILSTFILSSITINSQWVNQSPDPDGKYLSSVFFINDFNGWIVGSEGFIIKTTNAGVDWVEQNSGTTINLKAVKFADVNAGWAVGEAGLIIKSANGGIDWTIQSSGTSEELISVDFWNDEMGWVAGSGGTLLKTTDGGTTWISLASGTTDNLYSLCFVNDSTGWVVGGNSEGIILKTTDGGSSWVEQWTANGIWMRSVCFIDENTGWVVGEDNSVLKTTDGGNNWISSDTQGWGGFTCVFFKDANSGFVAGPNSSNDLYLFATTDGGSTWVQKIDYWSTKQQSLNKSIVSDEGELSSVFVTNEGKGWAVGTEGKIYITADNGDTWSKQLSGSNEHIYSLHFINDQIGYAVGPRPLPYPTWTGVILKTTNSGKVWITQRTEGYEFTSFPQLVFFIDELHGWVFVSGLAELLITVDGGESWTAVLLPSELENSRSIFFIDQNNGWIALDNMTTGGIFKTTDGGYNWIQNNSNMVNSIYFVSPNTGWAVGNNGLILKSTDGGETWISKMSGTTENLNAVKFYNYNLGMSIGSGGTILLTSDGGETWNVKSGPELQTINFTNSTTVWGYTSDGTVYKTTNSGDIWNSLNAGLGFGTTAFFTNENTGWVGGGDAYGSIFKYSTEPIPLPVWSNQVIVEDAGGTENSEILIFGQAPNATDSIDAAPGEYEIPPSPPTSIFDARFNLPTNPQVSSLIDYRDSAKTDIIWTMQFQPGSAGYPMTFSWDSTAFPEGTFYLKDRINGSFVNVNMKNQSSYTLADPNITSLKISYKGICLGISINNGWNMISVPLLADDMSVSNLYANTTSPAYGYDNGYVTEDTLVTGTGYWLKFGGDEEIQICGSTMGDTVGVKTGWNMVGVYEEDILVNQITTTPSGIIATYFFGYEDGYNIADTLKSGKGYWVRVTEDGRLNLNGGTLEKVGDKVQFIKINQEWGQIKITDNESNSMTLYATEKEINSNLYELPPMPPAGVFDARFRSGKFIEDLSSEKVILISSDRYPITIRAEGINLTVRDRINGELLNEDLSDGEEIRITNNKITAIAVTGTIANGLPVSYELYQNYPNPFNPTTTIKFAVPNESNVNLSIYNVLGELVSTIVNEQMKPGYYEYEFNASDLASGVYLYRINTDSFVETKKMILMK